MAHWADIDAIESDALAVLRMDSSDPDADRVREAAEVAVPLIDAWLDVETPYEAPNEPLTNAAVRLTVELYRRGDVPFGQAGGWDAAGPITTMTANVLAGVRSQLLPYRQRWGIA